MKRLHISQVGINYSQVWVPKNPVYDFIFRPLKPPHDYEGELDDLKDWVPTLFWIYFYVFYF